ncbi:MAG: hypothetical protein M3P38_04970 [Chloroflexota bacterium]|nr:hypothetical protein [Chloroflexota bacterium]
MRIDLGEMVRTKDGHKAGHVKHAIWDLGGKEITQFVIATSGLLGHDVIVSKEILESAARDGSQIVLDIDKHELDELARYEAADYAPPPPGWLAPVTGFPAGGHLFPIEEEEIARQGEPGQGDEASRESETAGREKTT